MDKKNVTPSTPKPGNYPVGSVQSRAAARAMAEGQKKDETVLQIVFVTPDGEETMGPRLGLNGLKDR